MASTTFDRLPQQVVEAHGSSFPRQELDTVSAAAQPQQFQHGEEEDVLLTSREGVAQPLTIRRHLVLAAAFVGVLACVGLAVGMRSGDPRDGSSHGVVQLDSDVYNNMHSARAEMQQKIDALSKKFEPMKREDRPDRLQHMRQRLKQARNKLQDNVAALRQRESDEKLAKLEPAKAVVLSAMRNDLTKGLSTLRTATLAPRAARGTPPAQRRQLQEAAERMRTGVDSLAGKLDKFKRMDRPDRLHEMRQRLQSAKLRLQTNIDKLQHPQ